MKQKTLFTVALIGLFAAFIVATLLFNVERAEEEQQASLTSAGALVRGHSPAFGPADAPVTVVEFLDPACETCAAFYAPVKELLAANPGKIRLVIRYAPFHKGSDQVVAILEAARRQGKFREALEALLATQADWSPHHTPQVERVWKHLDGLGLDLEQVRRDMWLPETGRVIAQDLDDARLLNVTKTPEFFVNGRPLPRFGWEPLQQAVTAALRGR
ncbi:MAG: disulfide bond formation protein DsbA [Betaproteobacteria bacterium]|nr:disulfide bond formation protein DsbA [Betaproteobacteria bacterium]